MYSSKDIESLERGPTIYSDQFKDLLHSLSDWVFRKENGKLNLTINDFMDNLWNLYLDYFQFHIEDAKFYASQYHDLIVDNYSYIHERYISKTIYRIRSADDYESKWDLACKFRSNIEVFQEIFGHIVGKINSEGFDDIVEYVEDCKGTTRGFSREMDKVPQSHWWWFRGID